MGKQRSFVRAVTSSILPALCIAAVCDLASAATVRVDGADDAAIMRAVAQAQAGDTIRLDAGVYGLAATVSLKSGVRLEGAGADKTTLEFRGATPCILLDMSGCEDTEVCALTLDGAGNPNATQGISAGNARRLRIHDITVRNLVKGNGFGPHGILFSGRNPDRTNGVTDSEIADCRFEHIGEGADFGGAIRLSWGSSGNRVLRNTIAGTGRGGIFADNGSTDLVIRGNTVSGSGGEGLGIEVWGGCDRCVIEDNRIDHWLSIGGCDTCAARRNTISDTSGVYKFCGLEAIGAYLILTGNTIDGGQKIGLSLSSSQAKHYVYWGRNTVRACNQWGSQFQGESGGIYRQYLYHCVFEDMPLDTGAVWYPGDEGHGFRIHSNTRDLVFEDCVFRNNGRLGFQNVGSDTAGLRFRRCLFTGNKGPAFRGLADSAVAEWTDCRVDGNGADNAPQAPPASPAPHAITLRAPERVQAGTKTLFTVSVEPQDTPEAVLWDFDDGLPLWCGAAESLEAEHVYTAAGACRVTAIAWFAGGDAARGEIEVAVDGK